MAERSTEKEQLWLELVSAADPYHGRLMRITESLVEIGMLVLKEKTKIAQFTSRFDFEMDFYPLSLHDRNGFLLPRRRINFGTC